MEQEIKMPALKTTGKLEINKDFTQGVIDLTKQVKGVELLPIQCDEAKKVADSWIKKLKEAEAEAEAKKAELTADSSVATAVKVLNDFMGAAREKRLTFEKEKKQYDKNRISIFTQQVVAEEGAGSYKLDFSKAVKGKRTEESIKGAIRVVIAEHVAFLKAKERAQATFIEETGADERTAKIYLNNAGYNAKEAVAAFQLYQAQEALKKAKEEQEKAEEKQKEMEREALRKAQETQAPAEQPAPVETQAPAEQPENYKHKIRISSEKIEALVKIGVFDFEIVLSFKTKNKTVANAIIERTSKKIEDALTGRA